MYVVIWRKSISKPSTIWDVSEEFLAPKARAKSPLLIACGFKPQPLYNHYLNFNSHNFIISHKSQFYFPKQENIFLIFTFITLVLKAVQPSKTHLQWCYTKSEPRVPFHLQWTKATNMTIIKYLLRCIALGKSSIT